MIKQYQFFCDNCNYKRLTNGSDIQDLIPVKTSPVPGSIPYIDPLTKKTIYPPAKSQKKKFKCPKCGKIIIAKEIIFTEKDD